MTSTKENSEDGISKNSGSRDSWKAKISSAWNELKYSWYVKVQASFNEDQPLCLLGKQYIKDHIVSAGCAASQSFQFDQFYEDFHKILWFTYRKGFPPLPGSSLTNDCGWGCMLRSGQMLFAEILSRHLNSSTSPCQLLKWFIDEPSQPFSIHRMVSLAITVGKSAGDWFGPTSIAHILNYCLDRARLRHTELRHLKMYVAQDCNVHLQDLIAIVKGEKTSVEIAEDYYKCERKSAETMIENLDSWSGLVIIMPMRLGGEKFNMTYYPFITGVLNMSSCVGIIGGKPKHSLYFVGCQGDSLIYLDPHYCQEVTFDDIQTETYHCPYPKKINCKKMDPSCAIGFYLHTKEDLMQFLSEMRKMQHLSVFDIVETSNTHDQMTKYLIPEERYVDLPRRYVDKQGFIIEKITSEEFVFI